MSETTIHVPTEHVEAIRQALTAEQSVSGNREDVARILAQLPHAPPADAAPYALTGPREILWSAVYDSLCGAAEQLAEDCNEYWRGASDAEAARAAVAAVGARLELLVGLGEPPAG